MSTLSKDIESQALKLSPQSRARLAQKLLHSLEGLSEEENEALWLDEADRRDRELEAGGGEPRSADEVLRDVRSRLA
jgi:hypothetical protein